MSRNITENFLGLSLQSPGKTKEGEKKEEKGR
jgi:hypothetical protein